MTNKDDVMALPGPPVFNLTTKYIQFEAPSATGLPLFRSAMTAGLRTLQAQEQFQFDAGDSDAVAATREAIGAIHAILTGITAVANANLTELEAYQQAMANYQQHQNNFGLGFAQDASSTEDYSDEDDPEF